MARKQHKYHYIYKITCLRNNRYYIGMHSTSNLEDGYYGGGKIIKNSVKKYGKESHKKEILEFFEDREKLRNREIELVTEELVNDPMCMNLQLGGGGGFINKEHTLKCSYYGNLALSKKIKEDNNFREEWTKKLSIAWKKRFSDPSKEIPFRVTFEGMKHSEETKISISLKQKENQKGEKNSQFGSIWIYKEGTEKKIKNIQFPEFESNGWNKGRLKNKVL